MATARLDDTEKSRITNGIDRIIKRALYNKEFPLEKERMFEWLLDQLTVAQAKAYRLLKADCPALVTTQSYGCDFKIATDTHVYRIGLTAEVPCNSILVRHDEIRHAEVIEWAEWWNNVNGQVDAGQNYFNELVYACTSVGQIKRLMPDEILRFVPDYLLDFSQVERQSRIPASFKPDADKMEATMKILTLGAISPEKRKGMHAWVELIAETK